MDEQMKNGTHLEGNRPSVPAWARFRTRLALLILLVFLPALALTIYTNLRQRQTEMTRIREGAVALARLVAAKQENFVKNTRQLFATLSPIQFLVSHTNRPYSQAHFINLRTLSPDYSDFGLIEADGTLFCSAAVTNRSPDLSRRSHFQRVVNTKRFSIGDFQGDGLTTEPSLDFGYPIFDDRGRLSRVMYASFKLAVLNEVAAQVDLPSEATLTVLDGSGNVLVRYPKPEQWVGKALAQEPFVQRILRAGETVFEMQGLDGIERLFAVAAISDGREPRLFVTVGLPTQVVFAGANQALLQSILVLGIVATLALLVAHYYARYFLVRPLNALVLAARRLAAGQWPVRTGIAPGKGELSELGRAFDEMAARLEQRQKEIEAGDAEVKRSNAELERRVKDRTAQLEAANDELEAFSYSVSHDLRAPLRHTDGYAQLLRQDRGSQLSDKARRYAEEVSHAVKRMGRLIDDLLSFSRMGRDEMRRSEWNMNEVVQEVLRDLSTTTEGRSIEWKIAPLPQVCVDRAMLKQVWANLLSNAVKYTRNRERAQITVGFNELAEEFECFVQDNGAGFDMEYASKLFGVFQRLHRDEEFEGTGIGLAYVRRIIHRHGGRTWAEGKVDAGAIFHFTLPRFSGKECR